MWPTFRAELENHVSSGVSVWLNVYLKSLLLYVTQAGERWQEAKEARQRSLLLMVSIFNLLRARLERISFYNLTT